MRPDRLAFAAVAACSLAGAAAAQPSPPPDSGAAPPTSAGPHAERRAMRQAHEAREAADLSTVLRLRPDQQAGLQAWLAADRPGPHRWHGPMQPAAPPTTPSTTPQVLDRDAARMAEHDAVERGRLDATRRFYASLAPDQQAVFDALERLRHGRGEGGPHGRWGRRHGGPGGMSRGPDGHGPGGTPPPAGD